MPESHPENSPRPVRAQGVPLLGNTFQFLRDTSGLLNDAYQRYGPVYRLRALWLKYTVIAGFEAKDFLQQGLAEKYLSREKIFNAVGEQLGSADFVLAQSGERHDRFRRLLSLAYSRDVASPFVPAFIQATKEYVRQWQPGATFTVMDHVKLIAFDQYSRAMCGRSLMDHHRDCLLVTDYNMNIGGRVWPFFLFKAPWYTAARKRVLDLMWGMVAQRRMNSSAPAEPRTIMDTLLAVTDKSGQHLSDDEVVCYSMYGFAGSASYMGRAVGFMLYEILRHPELHRQLVGEVDDAFARGLNDASDVRRMMLLRAVYNESLRLHPVSQGMPFHTEKDFVFRGNKVCAGETTVLSQVPMSFAPQCWNNPHTFDPARMLEPRNEHRANGAFHPFGIAHRTCTAMGLVELMAVTMVAALLHELDFEMSPADYRLRFEVKPLPAPDSKFRIRVRKRRVESDHAAKPAYIPDEHITADFAAADSAVVREALQNAGRQTFESGQAVIRQGDEADSFFLITAGTASVSRVQDDVETELARLSPGDFFGEIGLLHGIPRTATVSAVNGPLEVLVLSRETFLAIIADSDLLSGEIAAMMRKRVAANRMREAVPRLEPAGLARVFPEFETEIRQPGETVIREGTDAGRFYIVLAGEAVVTKALPDGGSRELARLPAGRYFGETGLLNRSPRNATVSISEAAPATLLSTGRDSFYQMLQGTAGAESDLAQLLLNRIARV